MDKESRILLELCLSLAVHLVKARACDPFVEDYRTVAIKLISLEAEVKLGGRYADGSIPQFLFGVENHVFI